MTEREYSVSALNEEIRALLATNVGPVIVRGEISGYRRARGNLVYFDLKDEQSRVLCFLLAWQQTVPLSDGMEVRVLGTPSLFRGSSGFHIRVEEISLVGEGALAQALRQLRETLDREGLFAPERKRPLPRFPRRIGLITSPDAAAYTDVLKVLRQRWTGFTVRFAPVHVQGMGAVRQIVRALKQIAQPDVCDVVILTRGGGSLEDLQAFNAEDVARAIFASGVPVVVGVGHERDTTIADDVADVRAATPSHAAERVAPDRHDIARQVAVLDRTVEQSYRAHIGETAARLDDRQRVLRTAVERVRVQYEALQRALRYHFQQLQSSTARFRQRHRDAARSLHDNVQRLLRDRRQHVTSLRRLLATLSPHATLRRGYSITRRARDRSILRTATAVHRGETLVTTLAHGTMASTVTDTDAAEDD
ncbi:MAG: exodeoxyribonuclease VII large subunit [Candidatus Kerfeldbacteria bacterium]|nr:exodeoxyribonuclease VII large subunit [Candidatus Kerfeldbacteria bacterium]